MEVALKIQTRKAQQPQTKQPSKSTQQNITRVPTDNSRPAQLHPIVYVKSIKTLN
jgi:hypothetical protein